MEILKSAAILVIGFVLLIKGADFFVEGSSSVAKKFNVPYYMGIDNFLKEYKNAVYSCLTNLQ